MNQNETTSARRVPARWRRLCVCLLAALVLSLCPVALPASAATTVPVTLPSGSALSGALLLDGVTYVPLRAFCSSVDTCEIRWDAKTRTAFVTLSSDVTVAATQDATYLWYGGRCFYTVTPIRNVGGTLYVPIRPLARCFGLEAVWSSASRSVRLQRNANADMNASHSYYDADDLYWLSRIIQAEAGGESFRGQIAVGNVVLNRVRSSQYPNSVYGVVFDKKFGVQFTPAATGQIYNEPSTSAIRAAKICLEGYTLSDRILYFFNPAIASSSWIAQNRTYAFRIGGHVFYE